MTEKITEKSKRQKFAEDSRKFKNESNNLSE